MSEVEIDDDIIDPKVEKRLLQTANTLTTTANKAERDKLQADVDAFLKAGGKITIVDSGLTAFTPYSVYAKHSIEKAAEGNRNRPRKFTERQKKIVQGIHDAIGDAASITYEKLRNKMHGISYHLPTDLRLLSQRGYIRFDGETISKAGG